MNLYCVVTIDTECDRGIKWRNILPVRYTSVTDLIPNVFQKIFTKHLVKPTYLLSPEVLESKICVDILKSLSAVELGTHLHGEFVEPAKSTLGEFTGEIQAQYSPEMEAVKLGNLTRIFEEKLGFKPTSFRAGRWGISPHTFRILENLGYLVDSSITPYFMWKFPNYILNYKTAFDVPYFPSRDNFFKQGDMRLLEIPVTIFSQYGRLMNGYASHLPSLLRNQLMKIPLWRPLWLRPTYSNFSQMKYVIDAHIASHLEGKDIVFNMMFHSIEILPDENPYNFNKKRIELFINSIEQTFEYLSLRGVKFLGLTDIYPIFKHKESDAFRY